MRSDARKLACKLSFLSFGSAEIVHGTVCNCNFILSLLFRTIYLVLTTRFEKLLLLAGRYFSSSNSSYNKVIHAIQGRLKGLQR